MSDHIVQSFDIEFEILGCRIGEMGGVAEKMLADAMDALCAGDVDLAR
jgi:phosphate transport system protein